MRMGSEVVSLRLAKASSISLQISARRVGFTTSINYKGSSARKGCSHQSASLTTRP
jgi:hypothetical protein